MARRCELSGKGVHSGNRVSHAKNRSRHRFFPNLQKKRIWSAKRKCFLTMTLATSTIRTLDKIGIDKWLSLISKANKKGKNCGAR